MDYESTQIPPPKSWEQFEELCLALWQELWTDPLALKNGRRGQPQCGVDVYGQQGGKGPFHGVQCKGKDQGYGHSLSIVEVLEEIKKAEHFSPPLAGYVIAATAARDVRLQQFARELTVQREARGQFPVAILSWEDLQSMIGRHRRVLERFYPQYAADAQGLLQQLRALTSARSLAAGNSPSVSRQVASDSASAWVEVHFAADRDIGPALLGRGLGAGDALACPRLEEADTLVAELRRAFSARLSGVPGAGKSVCCFQAAASLRTNGWSVKSLEWPPPADLRLPEGSTEQPVLYVIDDAHRLPPSVIHHLEQAAGPSRYVLRQC